MTVLEVLQTTTAYFKKRQIENPRLNAEHLLAHAFGRKRIELYLEFDRELSETTLSPLRELVRRRGQGEPLQHLLGKVEFCGLTFLCDQRALVPRPETEQLVELIIANCQVPNADGRLLDVGTGSGVIALSLAQRFPEMEIVGIDLSEEALTLARENAARLGINRVRFIRSDLLQGVEGKFDLIVANLPYVGGSEEGTLSREVLHDPKPALFAGEHGDELIRHLITAAPGHLRANGMLVLESGSNQSTALTELLTEKNYHDISAKKDYAGMTRFLFARYG